MTDLDETYCSLSVVGSVDSLVVTTKLNVSLEVRLFKNKF